MCLTFFHTSFLSFFSSSLYMFLLLSKKAENKVTPLNFDYLPFVGVIPWCSNYRVPAICSKVLSFSQNFTAFFYVCYVCFHSFLLGIPHGSPVFVSYLLRCLSFLFPTSRFQYSEVFSTAILAFESGFRLTLSPGMH